MEVLWGGVEVVCRVEEEWGLLKSPLVVISESSKTVEDKGCIVQGPPSFGRRRTYTIDPPPPERGRTLVRVLPLSGGGPIKTSPGMETNLGV